VPRLLSKKNGHVLQYIYPNKLQCGNRGSVVKMTVNQQTEDDAAQRQQRIFYQLKTHVINP
jgi:hypothetical protein